MAASIVPVILSGGPGTRLWPLSRATQPKQLLNLVTEKSLLQDTVARVRHLTMPVYPPLVVCNELHAELVASQLEAMDAPAAAVVLEPAGRNSSPAVAAAALAAQTLYSNEEDPLLLVLPADHVIRDVAAFAAAVATGAVAAKAGRLVTFGIVPTRAETGYGYILPSEYTSAGWAPVQRFIEKPPEPEAREFLASGRYLWNSGMFLFAAGRFLAELERLEPVQLEACRRATAGATRDGVFLRLGEAFLEAPSSSVDYSVMEKTALAAVVPLDAGWSDVGSWAALHEAADKDASGNHASGRVVLERCRDTYVQAHSRVVAAVGLTGVSIIETDEAVLVVAHDAAEHVKTVAGRVAALGEPQGKG